MSPIDSLTGWPGVSEPLTDAKLRVLSLGAGVQSSTLALMATAKIGFLLDCAIFANTTNLRRKGVALASVAGNATALPCSASPKRITLRAA